MSGLLTPMTTDPGRVEFNLHEDSRLIPAIGAIVSHAAQRAGLSPTAQNGLAEAAVEACRDTFPLVQGHGPHQPELRLIIEDFPDRVEVTIEHSGEDLPTAGLDSFVVDATTTQPATGISHALQNTNVDRVQYEKREGRSRMTLIKYCDGRRAKV
jgi:hypothetical protein